MKNEDGTYSVTVDELKAFEDSGKEFWFLNFDGTSIFTDVQNLTDGWPVYLMNNDPKWFEQWNGDYEAAVAQLRVLMTKNLETTPLPPAPE